jgi:hypothetical protein
VTGGPPDDPVSQGSPKREYIDGRVGSDDPTRREGEPDWDRRRAVRLLGTATAAVLAAGASEAASAQTGPSDPTSPGVTARVSVEVTDDRYALDAGPTTATSEIVAYRWFLDRQPDVDRTEEVIFVSRPSNPRRITLEVETADGRTDRTSVTLRPEPSPLANVPSGVVVPAVGGVGALAVGALARASPTVRRLSGRRADSLIQTVAVGWILFVCVVAAVGVVTIGVGAGNVPVGIDGPFEVGLAASVGVALGLGGIGIAAVRGTTSWIGKLLGVVSPLVAGMYVWIVAEQFVPIVRSPGAGPTETVLVIGSGAVVVLLSVVASVRSYQRPSVPGGRSRPSERTGENEDDYEDGDAHQAGDESFGTIDEETDPSERDTLEGDAKSTTAGTDDDTPDGTPPEAVADTTSRDTGTPTWFDGRIDPAVEPYESTVDRLAVAVDGLGDARPLRDANGVLVCCGTYDGDPVRLLTVPSAAGVDDDVFQRALSNWRSIGSDDGVVTVRESGTDPRPWVITDPVTPIDPPEDPRDRVEVVRTVASAIRQAGLYDTNHHSLRPELVVETPDGTPQVDGWGVRDLLERDREAPTPYDAPEQIAHEGSTARETTIYRLGATAYDLLTGHPPYDDSDDLAEAIREGDLVAPSEVDDSLPGDVDFAIERAMDPDPDRRYTSAHHMRLDLQLDE